MPGLTETLINFGQIIMVNKVYSRRNLYVVASRFAKVNPKLHHWFFLFKTNIKICSANRFTIIFQMKKIKIYLDSNCLVLLRIWYPNINSELGAKLWTWLNSNCLIKIPLKLETSLLIKTLKNAWGTSVQMVQLMKE